MPDIQVQVNQFNALQQAIWQQVSVVVSEPADTRIGFHAPLVVTGRPEEMFPDLAAPSIVVQFHFASSPENAQVVLLPQDSAVDFASALFDREMPEITDDVLQEMRTQLEAIVQGICMGVSNIRNEPYAASGLSVRFQIFAFPPNLHSAETIVRTNVAWDIDGHKGPVVWLVDPETMQEINGRKSGDSEEALFGGEAIDFPTQGSAALKPDAARNPDAGLDILLDIPLDISVELGRVKMQVKDIVEMGTGSIVELDRAAGEPIDVLVNGRVVARGEVVVIEDNFGVRITEILTPVERLKRLGDRL